MLDCVSVLLVLRFFLYFIFLFIYSFFFVFLCFCKVSLCYVFLCTVCTVICALLPKINLVMISSYTAFCIVPPIRNERLRSQFWNFSHLEAF